MPEIISSDPSDQDVEEEKKAVSQEPPAPPVGSPRWNQIYYEKKNLERKVDAMETTLQKLQEQNNRLDAALSTKEKIEAAEDLDVAIAAAAEEDNTTKVLQLMSQKQAVMQARLENRLATEIAKAQQQAIQQNAAQSAEQIVDEFIAANPWYDKESQSYDLDMAAYADGIAGSIDNSLPLKARLAEVKARTEKVFGKKKSEALASRVSTVESGGAPVTNSRTEDRLSDEDKRILKKWWPELTSAQAVKKYRKQQEAMKSK